MADQLSRREFLAASLCLPAGLSAQAPAWNRPGPLGKSGLRVTRLAFGCAEARDVKLIRKAADLGINYFNSLPNRGLTDFKLVGEALRPIRRRAVLAGGSSEKTRQAMLDQLDSQLRDFGTDYLDMWYLIAKQKPEEISDELLEGVRSARQAGKIRTCVVSTHGFAAILPRVLEVREIITALMVTCNFATWPGTAENITKAHQAGVGIIAMKPLMAGLSSVPKDRQAWLQSPETQAKRQTIIAAALKWVLGNEQVDSAPVIMSTFEHLEGNVKAASETLSEGERQLLAAHLDRVSPYYCRMCQRCEGSCREGLPVPDVMRCLMYAEAYGNKARAHREFEQLPPHLQAVRCDQCPSCTVRCPNGVRIRKQLIRAQTLLA
jgi:hypothetical protein